MESIKESQIVLPDLRPGQSSFMQDVLDGLSKERKELPCKYFYDERGSLLFEIICTMDEYYIPYAEKEIMETRIEEIVNHLGRNVLLVEYGCGDCRKTRILLENLRDMAAYVPIDISWDQLLRVTGELGCEYPTLELLPVCTDYTNHIDVPVAEKRVDRRVVYFPGSTIGNFNPAEAHSFLEGIAEVCGPGGALLIGVDLKKDPRILHAAYNDSRGVTADFNLNMLVRINRELEGDFKLDQFEHYAFYNPLHGCVEMHLVSLKEQFVHLNGMTIPFAEGESIRTENSYKYGLGEFEELAAGAGFRVKRVWTDKRRWFSVQYLLNLGGFIP
jgi:dimethylhistidine N-methyltransferase